MIEPAQVPPRWGWFPSSDRGLRANSRDGGGRCLLVGFEWATSRQTGERLSATTVD